MSIHAPSPKSARSNPESNGRGWGVSPWSNREGWRATTVEGYCEHMFVIKPVAAAADGSPSGGLDV
jgi:hypothetical protein